MRFISMLISQPAHSRYALFSLYIGFGYFSDRFKTQLKLAIYCLYEIEFWMEWE